MEQQHQLTCDFDVFDLCISCERQSHKCTLQWCQVNIMTPNHLFTMNYFTELSVVPSILILPNIRVHRKWPGLDDVIKWKHFPRHWPFVRGIHRSPVTSPHKGQWRGALVFSLICALNKRLSKKSCGWWLGTPSRPSWRHCNVERSFQLFYTNSCDSCCWVQ